MIAEPRRAAAGFASAFVRGFAGSTLGFRAAFAGFARGLAAFTLALGFRLGLGLRGRLCTRRGLRARLGIRPLRRSLLLELLRRGHYFLNIPSLYATILPANAEASHFSGDARYS